MKKVALFLVFTICYLLPTTSVLAVSSTEGAASKEATTPAKKEQIKELRERLATRVAELRQTLRKAYNGEIKSISGKTIILVTASGERTIVTNEETLFFRIGPAGRKKISLSDLKVGEKIAAFGQISQLEPLAGNQGELTARVIIAKVLPINIEGKVTAVDTENGTINVQTPKRGLFVVDVETTTKILVWQKGVGLKKFGFSKIKVGDRVHVNGTTSTTAKDGENRISANRILVLPGKAVGIVGSPSPSASPTASPKASPTAE